MNRPLPWLRYVDAKDLDEKTIKLSKLEVKNQKGEKLGHVEGFIVDTTTGRPYWVVVDAGGWFKSRHFLLPIGHTRLDAQSRALITNLEKERVKRFPGFDLDKFEKMSVEELDRLGAETEAACCPGIVVVEEVIWTDQPHYQMPDWWREAYSTPPMATTKR